MNIIYNDGSPVSDSILETFERAAKLCMEKEGLSPDNIEISLTFASGEEIRELNRMYRNVDKRTDVLSFPMIEDLNELETVDDNDDSICEEDILLGDVVICVEKAEEQSLEYGHSKERELVYLFVHSVCHLLGYDHMTDEDKREMRTREEEVMSMLDLERGV